MSIDKVANIITTEGQKVISKAKETIVGSTAKTIEGGNEKLLSSLDELATKNIGKGFSKTTYSIEQAVEAQIAKLKQIASSIKEDYFILQDGKKTVFKIFEGTQQGTNKGFWALNNETGELFYTKFSKDNAFSQSESEVLTSQIYKLLGFKVPEMQVIKSSNGEVGLLSKFIPNLTPVKHPEQKINEGFAIDALLANWDAIISNNLQKNENGLYRIDFGGALNYRATGGKNKSFGIIPEELTTLINSKINYESANLFSSMTRGDLITSLKKVAKLDENELYTLINKYCNSSEGAKQEGEKIFAKLIRRKEFLSYALEYIENTPQKQGQTILEYLEEVKDKVIHTPLTEFETYLQKNPNAKTTYKVSFLDKFKSLFNRHKTTDHNAIKSNMLKQRDKMDPESILALRMVKTNDSKINLFIRHPINNQPCSFNGSDLERLDRTLSQSRIPQNTTLYRATGPYEFAFDDEISTKEFLDKFYKKGKYFTIETYPNTSLEKKCAEEFIHLIKGDDCIIYKINVPKGTNGAYMEGIEDAWNERNEEEILLPRNLIYRFKNRKPFFNHEEIELDIVNKRKPPKRFVYNFTDEIDKIKEMGDFEKSFPTGIKDKFAQYYIKNLDIINYFNGLPEEERFETYKKLHRGYLGKKMDEIFNE